MDAFAQSEEAFAAEALFGAYRSGDADEVKRCVSSRRLFLDLDNQVTAHSRPPWTDLGFIGFIT